MSAPVLLLAPAAVVFLPEGGDEELVTRLRSAVTDAQLVSAIVLALTTSGVVELPSFAIGVVGDDGSLRAFVRGAGRIRVFGQDGSAENLQAAAGVTTWHEAVFPDAVSAALGPTNGPQLDIEFLLGPARASANAAIAPVDAPARADRTLLPQAPDRDAPGVGEGPSAPIVTEDSDHTIHRDAAPVAPPKPDADLIPAADEPPAAVPAVGLISSVPGAGSAPAPTPSADVTPAVDAEHAAEEPAGQEDDHTIAAADHRRLLDDPKPPTGDRVPQSSVQAVLCVAGHPNPPHAPQCRACGAEIADRTVRDVPRPTLGRLRLSSGQVVELDRTQLLGRRPTVSDEVAPTDLPGLVTISDPEQSLLRVHVEVRLHGWNVYVVDCGSRNGTVVELPGHEPTRLRAGEPCMIVPSTRVALAEVVDFRFEVGER